MALPPAGDTPTQPPPNNRLETVEHGETRENARKHNAPTNQPNAPIFLYSVARQLDYSTPAEDEMSQRGPSSSSEKTDAPKFNGSDPKL
ncbi:hypothetical protein GCK72_026179 [Caenorhabditis remanei]|uniref:Uncharacterized protein n=1 Tax=Caenorhabditis remanei TaxID=31234 RepID=A0A6A5G4Q7_CAERE|nr:hypothetical protein GCK72_026179 [Caenorhabditis remanei]KAF1749711.1 hypothetical protein GCK72_026179 [Caenorhabditis remanei]